MINYFMSKFHLQVCLNSIYSSPQFHKELFVYVEMISVYAHLKFLQYTPVRLSFWKKEDSLLMRGKVNIGVNKWGMHCALNILNYLYKLPRYEKKEHCLSLKSWWIMRKMASPTTNTFSGETIRLRKNVNRPIYQSSSKVCKHAMTKLNINTNWRAEG